MGPLVAIVMLGNLAPQESPALLPPGMSTVTAPPARQLQVGPLQDLGVWDTVYAPNDADCLVLRRGSEWFRLLAVDGASPSPWFDAPELQHARIVGHVDTGDALWLVGEAPDHAPFALEPTLGKRIDFVVPGPGPGDRAPRVQWLLALPHLDAVLLMLESGGQGNWPRPDNRPLYFWAGLSKQEVVQTGLNLQYFSGDRRVAVFGGPAPLPWLALDLATGERLDTMPARSEAHVDFDWTHRDEAVPFTAKEPGAGVGGVSSAGRAVPLELELAPPHGATAKVFDAWVALRVFDHGLQSVVDSSLRFGPLREDARPLLLARQVEAYEVLGNGRCAFVVREPGPRFTKTHTSHAFVYDAAQGQVSDMLDGVERLPPLAKKLRETPGVEDTMSIELLASLGPAGHRRLALAWCRHRRADMRHRTFEMEELLPETSWHRVVLVTATGERGVAEIPVDREAQSLRPVSLFPTGRLVLQQQLRTGAVHLRATLLRLPE